MRRKIGKTRKAKNLFTVAGWNPVEDLRILNFNKSEYISLVSIKINIVYTTNEGKLKEFN